MHTRKNLNRESPHEWCLETSSKGVEEPRGGHSHCFSPTILGKTAQQRTRHEQIPGISSTRLFGRHQETWRGQRRLQGAPRLRGTTTSQWAQEVRLMMTVHATCQLSRLESAWRGEPQQRVAFFAVDYTYRFRTGFSGMSGFLILENSTARSGAGAPLAGKKALKPWFSKEL